MQKTREIFRVDNCTVKKITEDISDHKNREREERDRLNNKLNQHLTQQN